MNMARFALLVPVLWLGAFIRSVSPSAAPDTVQMLGETASRNVVISKSFLMWNSPRERTSPMEKRLLQVQESCPVDFVNSVDFSGFTKNKCPTNASAYFLAPTDSYTRCCPPFFALFCEYADVLNSITACADGFFAHLYFLKYDTVALPTFCLAPFPEDENNTGIVLNCNDPSPPPPLLLSSPPPPQKKTHPPPPPPPSPSKPDNTRRLNSTNPTNTSSPNPSKPDNASEPVPRPVPSPAAGPTPNLTAAEPPDRLALGTPPRPPRSSRRLPTVEGPIAPVGPGSSEGNKTAGGGRGVPSPAPVSSPPVPSPAFAPAPVVPPAPRGMHRKGRTTAPVAAPPLVARSPTPAVAAPPAQQPTPTPTPAPTPPSSPVRLPPVPAPAGAPSPTFGVPAPEFVGAGLSAAGPLGAGNSTDSAADVWGRRGAKGPGQGLWHLLVAVTSCLSVLMLAPVL